MHFCVWQFGNLELRPSIQRKNVTMKSNMKWEIIRRMNCKVVEIVFPWLLMMILGEFRQDLSILFHSLLILVDYIRNDDWYLVFLTGGCLFMNSPFIMVVTRFNESSLFAIDRNTLAYNYKLFALNALF